MVVLCFKCYNPLLTRSLMRIGFDNMLIRVLALIVICSMPNSALADTIYGCWTNGTEQLIVEGQKVVTTGGHSPSAQIDRHSASFMSPDGERDAGKVLIFRQLSDNEVARAISDTADTGQREIWNPCSKAVS